MTCSGGELVVKCLERAGVRVAFGTCGHTNIALLDAFANSSIRFISFRHEQVAAHAADAYFRASSVPAALILHNGPGLTNALTGIGDAMGDSSAVIAIVGDVAARHAGRDAFQEVALHADASQWEIARPLVKRAWKVDVIGQLAGSIARAVTLATTGRPGPVLVSVAMDLFSTRTELVPTDVSDPSSFARIRGDRAAIARAAALLRTAHRPAILAGGGALQSRAGAAILHLANRLGAPVITTLSGRGTVPEDEALAIGPVGRSGSPAGNRAGVEADVLLALGTQFPEQDSSSWVPGYTYSIPPTKLVHVDLDPNQFGKIYPAEVAIVGDARAVIEDLLADLGSGSGDRTWAASLRADLEQWTEEKLMPLATCGAEPIHPARVLHELRAALPRNGLVLGDVGWGKNGTAQFFPVYEPATIHVASGFGTMGFAAASVLGAKIARPDVPVVAITGDGGFSSCFSAVMTAVEYNIPVIWVVINNGAFQSIMGLQQRHFGRTIGTVFGEKDAPGYNPDFAALARACGVQSIRVERPAELSAAFAAALASGAPFVIDVVTDPSALPFATGFWDIHEIYGTRADEAVASA
jgi:acetolactate synthase-1/2/3 large subunit